VRSRREKRIEQLPNDFLTEDRIPKPTAWNSQMAGGFAGCEIVRIRPGMMNE
jgi:hypothetical protein